MWFLMLFESSASVLLAWMLYLLIRRLTAAHMSTLRHLPGPASPSLIFGNFRQLREKDMAMTLNEWAEEYGPTYVFKGIFGVNRLNIMDTKAINHVLTNTLDYQKPGPSRYFLSRVLGEGLISAEGSTHTHQRKIMNPAFGPAQIRELTEIFVDKSVQLRDIWLYEISKQADGQSARIDILTWLSRMTLDVIGLAGFNYDFNSLNIDGKPNELNKALTVLLKTPDKMPIISILQAWVPLLRLIPTTEGKKIQKAKDTMRKIATQLLCESKEVIRSEKTEFSGKAKSRDLLSLLVRANTGQALSQQQKLTDEEVLAQIATFFVAGHETTSTGTTWALYALALDPAIQSKLRSELLTVSTDNPTMDELNALPYLDSVVREALRVHSPVPFSMRVAMKDDVLPLSRPVVDKKLKIHQHLEIRKGEILMLPILSINTDKTLWGKDAMEFKPERWQDLPEAVNEIPGYRFSVVEMKSLLFTLIRAFEFELAVPASDIVKTVGIVQRPGIRGDTSGSHQMPMLVRPYHEPY